MMKTISCADQLPTPTEYMHSMEQMAVAMQGMWDALRCANESINALEKQVRLLTKVTPAQASAINAAIRERAAEICQEYRATGHEKAAAAAIRKEVKLICGIGSIRELPRCEYSTAMAQVKMWDDYGLMKQLRAGKG